MYLENYITVKNENKHTLTAWGFEWTMYQRVEKTPTFGYIQGPLTFVQKVPSKDDLGISVALIYAAMFHSETILVYATHNVAFYNTSLLWHTKLL